MLSTFGMYNRPESAECTTDNIVTLGISLPRWSYGPLDPVSVYIKISPNNDWLSRARRVTINSITVAIEEEIVYNHEGDEPQRKTKTLAKQTQTVNVRMPEAGYMTNLGLVFPARELRDSEGILPRSRNGFPMYRISSFTTTCTLYKIEYFLTVRVRSSHPADRQSFLYLKLTIFPDRRTSNPHETSFCGNRLSYVHSTMLVARKKWKASRSLPRTAGPIPTTQCCLLHLSSRRTTLLDYEPWVWPSSVARENCSSNERLEHSGMEMFQFGELFWNTNNLCL
jgi:hypothetical protein